MSATAASIDRNAVATLIRLARRYPDLVAAIGENDFVYRAAVRAVMKEHGITAPEAHATVREFLRMASV